MVSHNNSQLLLEKTSDRVPHYGLRKLSYGVAPVLLFSTLYLAGVPGSTAHAATVSAESNAPAAAESVSGNAKAGGQTSASPSAGITTSNQQMAQVSVTSTESISPRAVAASAVTGGTTTIPVHVDHSALDSAVNSANAAGVKVVHGSDQSMQATQSDVSHGIQAAQSDEASQAASISAVTSTYLSERAQQSALTTGYGDTSSLDALVHEAQNTPGLSVIKDADTVRKFGDSSDGTVRNFNRQRQADYQAEEEQLRNAIATQQGRYQEYRQKVANLNNNQVINLKDILNNLHMNGDSSVHGSIEYLAPNAGILKGPGANWYEKMNPKPNDVSVGAYYDNNVSGPFMRITYTGFSHDNYYNDLDGHRHQISKIVVTYSNLQKQSNHRASFVVALSNGPARYWNGVDALYVIGFDQTYNFYDESGHPITFDKGSAWLPIGSLTRTVSSSDPNNRNSDHIEKVKVINNGQLFAITGGNASLHSDGTVYSDTPSTDAANVLGSDGGAAVAEIQNGVTLRAFIKPFSKLPVLSPWNANWNYFTSNITNIYEGKFATPPTSTVHYHYTSATAPKPQAPSLSYHYNELNVETDATKNWNENGKTTNNKIYIDGDTAHATISTTLNELPNYDNGKLQKFDLVDDYSNFAGKATVSSVQVLENGVDATNQYDIHDDGTGHVTATRKNLVGAPSGTFTMNIAFKLKTGMPSQGDSHTSTVTIPVNLDHSALNAAIEAARNAGLTVHMQAPREATVSGVDVENRRQAFERYEASQAAQINSEVQYWQADHNHYQDVTSDMNGQNALDELVRQAQSIPGLSVVKDADEVSQGSLDEFNVSRKALYQQEMEALRNAIASQKQNWENYQKQLDSYKNQLDTSTELDPTKLVQNLTLIGKDPSVTGTVTYLQEPSERKQDAISAGGFYTHDMNGEFLKADFTNFSKSYYIDANGKKHNIGKVTVIYSDLKLMNNIMQNNHARADFSVDTKYKDGDSPWNATNMHYVSSYTQQWFLYDENGHLLDLESGTAWLPINSLTRWHSGANWGKGNTGLPDDHIEEIKALSNAKLYTTPKGYATMHSDGYVYADNLTSGPDKGVPNTWNAEGGACIALLSNGAKFNWRVAQYPDADFNGTWNYNESNTDLLTGITITPLTSTVHYHYASTNASAPVPPTITYQPTSLNQVVTLDANDLFNSGWVDINSYKVPIPGVKVKTTTPDPKKHWTVGEETVDNKLYINDDVAQSTVSMTLPQPSDLAHTLTNVSLIDDYSRFAQYVKVLSTHVIENGQDVTAQYTVTDNGHGHITAVRKDPASTPSGEVKLVVNFKLGDNIPSGTVLVNAGSGTLDNDEVPTNTPSVTTYTPDPKKHWVEGDKSVDGKLYINGDTANARIDMNVPKPSELAQPLHYLSVTDDYHQMKDDVQYVGARVLENGTDATNNYNITNDGQGHITAVRKQAAAMAGGVVSLLVQFTILGFVPNGTKLINGGSGRLNDDMVPTNEPSIVTYKPDVEKHWTDGDQVVDNQMFIDGDVVNGTVDFNLPNKDQLAKPLSQVSITDDFSQFKDLVDVLGTKVFEAGQDVTSQYTIVNDGNGHIVATRKDASSAPSGQLKMVVSFKIHDNVKTNTILVNAGRGQINHEIVPSNQPSISTYEPVTEKHWINGQGVVVDNKVYVAGDNVQTRATMILPDQNKMAKHVTQISMVDDYSQFKDHVNYQNAQVLVNNQDVTNQFTIQTDLQSGKVTATAKNPGALPVGSMALVLHFAIKQGTANETKLINSAQGQINNVVVPTNKPSISVYLPAPDKHWTQGGNIVDHKLVIDNDELVGKIDLQLPNKFELADPLTDITLVDDYSKMKVLVDRVSTHVLENGQDVTSQYSITDDGQGHVTAVRKNPGAAPKGMVSLLTTFKIHHDVPSNTDLVNQGSATINHQTMPTPTPDVTTYTPTTDKHWVDGDQVVDNHAVIDGDTVMGRVSMTLPTPTDLSQPLTYVDVIDDYSNFNDLVDYVSAKVLENNQDVTSQYTISDDGRGHVMAVRKDPAHTPGGQVTLQVIFKIHSGVKSGTFLINQGSGTLNHETVPTPTPKIVIYEPKTDKHWMHNGEIIDNKIVVNDDVVTGQVMMDLPKQSTLTHALTDVTIMDDFTQFQGLVDYQVAQVFENGQNVTDQYTIENDGNGHVTATRKNPAAAPEGKVALAVAFKLHHDVKSGTELVNGGAGTLNHETVLTPTPKIVTYTPATDKHWVEGSQNVDGKLYLDGETATAQVQMALPDASQLADKLHKVVLTDDFSQFASLVDVAGVKVLENGQDATSQYNVMVDKAGKIVATRKDPASTPSGHVILQVQFMIHGDVKNDTKLVNKGAGQINDDTVVTPTPDVDVYRPDAYKHWTEGGRVVDNKVYVDNDQVSTTVTMTIADPAKYAKGLRQVMLTDDYSQFAGVVKYDGVQVLNNGQDVTKDFAFTNNAQTGLLIATANNPMSLKGGTLNLVMHFTINPGTPNGMKLINSAKGTINNLTVPTNKPAISIYEPQPDKHWMQNGQIVDHKLVVNHDAITAKIDLQLPKQADLANPLSDVELVDDYGDFASHVDVQGVQVMENGQDVTSQYTVTNDGQHIVAVRKDAAHTPDGTVSLIVVFKLKGNAPENLKIVNHGSAHINHEMVPTPTPDVTIYTPQTDKHWVEGSQVVDGKVVMDDDLVHTKLDMTLPDTSQLSQPLTKVQLVDDFSQFMDLVDYQSAQVLENGQDVTSQYTITNDGHGHLIATRNDAAKAPAGHVSLLASFLLHHDVKSGVELVNSGSGTLNDEMVPMPNPKVVTYEPDTDKHWVEGSQVMDNKTYIDGDEVHADVSMSLPKPDTLAHVLTHVSVMDDFSRFMDLVDYQGAQVFENGQDVTSDYTLTDDGQGHITATRKNAAGAPEGMVVLHVNFKIHNDVKSGTELINGGQGQLNFDAVPTPKRKITVYHTTAEKHWELDDQVTDNQLYMNGTQATADVTVNLPDAKNLANKLTHFVMTDDYSHFANHVKVAKVQVLENGHDVTNEYDIQDHDGLIVATRKDASTTPSGTAILRTVFDINGDVPEGTTLENHGSATVNFDTQPVPPTKIVTWNPQPKKDVGTDEVDGGIMDSVNHKLVADGSTLTYGLSNPDLPANRSQKVTSLKVVDKLDNHVEYLGFKAFVKGLDGQMVDITKDFTATRDGQTITFEQKADTLDMYNDNLKRATAMPVIDLYVKVNGQMVKISNQYDLYINNVKTTSNTVDNHTPNAPKPKKEDLNENGVSIDGMNVLPGSVNDYRITADYSQYEGIQADKGLQRFLIVDDFPEDAVQPDLSLIKATDSKGQMVNGLEYHIYQSLADSPSEVQALLKSAGISPKGAFIVAQPKDMGAWFKNYVQTGDSITLEMPMTVEDAFNGQYQNAAYEVDFGHGYATNIVTNNVPKINPHKDAISVDGQNLDGKQIAVGQVFKYDLEGQVLPKNEGHDLFQYQFVDDYDQAHDQYFGQYRVYLTSDVQLKDGTILKKGTDVTDKTTQKIDTEKGIVTIAFNKDFLASIDVKNSEFGANAEIQMKRIAAGTVKNTYLLWINGKEYKSNTVTTTTPEPKKPAPKPQATPTPAPKPQAKPAPAPQPAPVKVATPVPAPASKPESPKLPQTGSGEDVMALMALGLALAGLSLGLLKKQRYDLR